MERGTWPALSSLTVAGLQEANSRSRRARRYWCQMSEESRVCHIKHVAMEKNEGATWHLKSGGGIEESAAPAPHERNSQSCHRAPREPSSGDPLVVRAPRSPGCDKGWCWDWNPLSGSDPLPGPKAPGPFPLSSLSALGVPTPPGIWNLFTMTHQKQVVVGP